MQEKACEWIRFGAQMVLVVDPDRKRVAVYRSTQEVRILGEDDVMDGGEVIPGWRLEIRELFEE